MAKKATKLMSPALQEGETLLALDPSSTRTGWAIGRAGQLDATVMACGAVSRPGNLDGKQGSFHMAITLQETVEAALGVIGDVTDAPKLTRVIAEAPGSVQSWKQPERRAGLPVLAFAAGVQVGAIGRLVPLGSVYLVDSSGWSKMSKADRVAMFTLDVPRAVYDPSKDTGDQDTGDAIALMRWWCRIHRAQALAGPAPVLPRAKDVGAGGYGRGGRKTGTPRG